MTDKKPQIYTIFFGSLALCAITIAYAAYELRGLHADSAYHLLILILRQKVLFWETARNISYALQQWAAVLALRTGVTDIITLARIYSFTVLFTPLAFIILSYFILPKDQKHLFLFPVFYYLAGVMSSSFSAIGEAQIAGTYFWLLFFMILFHKTGGLAKLLILILSCPIFLIHESYAIMAPLLATASCYRLLKSSSTAESRFFAALMLLFIAATLVVLSFILLPKSDYYQARSQLYFSTVRSLGFLVAHGYINPPALLGLLAGCTLLAGVYCRKKHFTGLQKTLLAIMWLASVAVAISPLITKRALSPSLQFDARSYGPLLIPLLALALAASLWSSWARQYFASRFVAATILALTLGQCGWHFAATCEWRNFISVFRTLLDQHHGLVSFEEAIKDLPPDTQHNIIRMHWPWTMPTLSILLADGGKVRTIIANPGKPSYEPFDPAVLNEELLSNPHFDFSAYLAELNKQKPID